MSGDGELHKGHRQRMFDRFRECGLSGFDEHEILEVILFSIIPRQNTNETAHRLIAKFGTLMGVFRASPDELETVKGVGSGAAAYLSFLGELILKYREESFSRLRFDSYETLLEYSRKLFVNGAEEAAYLLCLDNRLNLISTDKLSDGLPDMVNIEERLIVYKAIASNCTNIVLVHNHPDGSAGFSAEDINETRKIINIIKPLKFELLDHIIVFKNRSASMRQLGMIKEYWN